MRLRALVAAFRTAGSGSAHFWSRIESTFVVRIPNWPRDCTAIVLTIAFGSSTAPANAGTDYAMAGILGGARRQEAAGIKPTQGPGIFGTPIPEKGKGSSGGE